MMNRLSAKRILSTASVMVLNGNTTAYEDAIKLAIEALSQPERPKGRWVKRIRFSIADYTCSKCGCWTSDEHNYCPDCGADMVRGEEE